MCVCGCTLGIGICYSSDIHPFNSRRQNDIQQGETELFIFTLGRRQSKTLLTIDERGSNIARNGVFDCHLSPVWRQMAIKNSVSNGFLSTFVDSINV